MVRWLHAACRRDLLTSVLLRHQKLWDSFMDWWISNEQELWNKLTDVPQFLSANTFTLWICGADIFGFLGFRWTVGCGVIHCIVCCAKITLRCSISCIPV